MNLFDTHVHYYFEAFDADRDTVLATDRAAGVRHTVQIGCDEVSSVAAIKMATAHDGVHATVGLHPMDVAEFAGGRSYGLTRDYAAKATTHDELFAVFDELIKDHRQHVVGVGETGFDRHYVDTPERIALQEKCFLRHLTLAKKYDLPVIIHSRDAAPQTTDFVKEHMPKGAFKAVVHCFSDSEKEADFYVCEHDFYLGVGGVVTYANAENVRAAVKAAPLDRILTETDAPFLVPKGYRKTGAKRCESRMMDEVVQTIATLKDISFEACAAALYANGCAFYGIKP